MNAVLKDVSSPPKAPPPQAEVRIPGRDLSWIDATFSAWGEWIWEHRDYEGYPQADSVTSYLMGAGGGGFGSRVPVQDTPRIVRFAHGLYLMLPEIEGVVVFAEFVPGANEDGQLWTRAQKCASIQLEEEAFRKRLWRAKVRIWQWSR